LNSSSSEINKPFSGPSLCLGCRSKIVELALEHSTDSIVACGREVCFGSITEKARDREENEEEEPCREVEKDAEVVVGVDAEEGITFSL